MASFTGTAANETFVGGSADDIADGAGGKDTLKGGAGSDRISGGAGADTIEGGDGDDFLASFAYDTNFVSYPYSNTTPLDIHADKDTLTGGAGDDFFSAGYGDSVDGGEGRDGLIISFQGATSGITVNFSELYTLGYVTVGGATISDIEGVPVVEGSEFDDYIIGHNGDYFEFTRLYGRGGNDHLVADYKAWLLDGGDGDDILDGRYSQYLHEIVGGNGNDTIMVWPTSWATISGGEGNDTIDAGNGEVHGDGGDDTINAHENSYGEAQIHGDDGDDTLNGDISSSYLWGGSGADTLYGREGDDLLRSGGGDLASRSNTDTGLERDRIYGGLGNDDIGIGYGDVADGGMDEDKLSLDLSASTRGITLDTQAIISGGTFSLFGGTISNFELVGTIEGSAFADRITIAEQGSEAVVNGGAGADTVISKGSPVIFNGGTGADLFVNGAGADQVDGGAGYDTIKYSLSPLGVVVRMGATDEDWGTGPAGDTMRSVENIVGSAFNDKITGSNAANRLQGGAGNDVLDGGAGNDRLEGGTGIDTASYASAKAGVDVSLAITGKQNTKGAGVDVLIGIEKLVGSSYADRLTGTAGDDDLSGSLGDDILQGGLGANRLDGGAGKNDRASYASAGNGVTVQIGLAGAQATGWGSDTLIGIEGAIGSAFDDILRGNGGNNSLEGGAGNDLLDGAGGSDTASYAGALAAVKVSLALSGAQDTMGAGTDTLISMENLLGSAFNDELTGNGAANVIDGGGGNDIIKGGGGADRLLGNDGDDLIFSGAASDIINGGAGFDTLSYELATKGVKVDLSLSSAQGTGMGIDKIVGIEALIGSRYGDALKGSDNADTIMGGLGNDLVNGGLGNDRLDGGAGSDTLSLANDTYAFLTVDLALTAAQDTGIGIKTITGFENVLGSQSSDTLRGDAGANRLDGGDGFDVLIGREGNDTLLGGTGDDHLVGGLGNDALNGGAGQDHFYFVDALVAGNVDTISDYEAGWDLIHLAKEVFSGLNMGIIQEANFRIGTAAADFDDRIIYDSATGKLYFDSDGSGVAAAVQFAQVDPGLALSNIDFYVF